MPSLSARPAEALPGALTEYRFEERLGNGPLGELWRVTGAAGAAGLARLVLNPGREEAWPDAALARLEAPGHAGFVPWSVAHAAPERLVLLAALTGEPLRDLCKWYRDGGKPGLPRDTLLTNLRTVAEAVDAFTQADAAPHLALNPCSIYDGRKGIGVLDAGLALLLLGQADGPDPFLINARYAAPELARGESGPTCDVYSLALIYQEMLTGCHAHWGRTPAQLIESRRSGKADLSHLPAADRGPVGRALHPDPHRRFTTCVELIDALTFATSRRHADHLPATGSLAPVIAAPCSPVIPALFLPPPRDFVADLVASAAGPLEIHAPEDLRCLLKAGESLVYRCGARLVPGLTRLKLDGFCRQWRGRILAEDGRRTVLRVEVDGGWWRRWRDRTVGLTVSVEVDRPAALDSQLAEVIVRVEPFGCTGPEADTLIRDVGLALVRSLREYLHANPEQRSLERLPFARPLALYPVLPDRQLGEALECFGKDVTHAGMGLVAARDPGSHRVYIRPGGPSDSAVKAILADLVRVHRLADGRFELGLAFQFTYLPDRPQQTGQAGRSPLW